MNRPLLAFWLVSSVACGGPHAAPHMAAAPQPRDPHADFDSDHVLDVNDRCPDRREDLDGFEDADGCPDPDNDQDGLADSIDLCPNQWEDCDGFQDSDGCPDLDNDQDRIPDVCDSCPDEPENYNGYEDGDGCPDHPYIIVSDSHIVILERPHFEKNSVDIPAESLTIIETVAAAMNANPQIELLAVEGHAELSEHNPHGIARRRADAVRDALAHFGVDPARLVVRESGSQEPVASNSTVTGRAQNRRVELLIVRVTPSATPEPFVDPRSEIQPACANGASPLPERPPPGGCGGVHHGPPLPALPPPPPREPHDGGAPLPTTIVPTDLRDDAEPPM